VIFTLFSLAIGTG